MRPIDASRTIEGKKDNQHQIKGQDKEAVRDEGRRSDEDVEELEKAIHERVLTGYLGEIC